MFKFIRRYQKWLLVVFCALLMFAFLVQPVMSIFFPDPSKRTIGTVYAGQKVTENQKQRAVGDLSRLRQLGFVGIGLFPIEDSEADAGLAWLLMVRAGKHAGFTASDNEAWTALTWKQSEVTQEIDTLDAFASKHNLRRADLLGIVKQYLIAEQYRQLVMGHTFEMRQDAVASPGLNRVRLENEVLNSIDQYRQFMAPAQFQQFAANGILENTLGRPRISDSALRHIVQDRRSQISGTLVVFEAEVSELQPSEEKLQELFDLYKEDFAGQGDTYGFGYRQYGRVRLEAVRIPFEAVYAVAIDDIAESDVREYFDKHTVLYENWQPRDAEPEEEAEEEIEEAAQDGDGEATSETEDDSAEENVANPTDDAVAPADPEAESATDTTGDDIDLDAVENNTPRIDERVRIDYRLREEIRQVLILERINELQGDIARDIHRMLAEDARVLDEAEGFKVIPYDFVPTPLTQVASRILEDYNVALEIIADNGEWVSLPTFGTTQGLVGGMAQIMPMRSVWPIASSGDALRERRIPTTTLSGRLGLLSSGFQQQDLQGQFRFFPLSQRIASAKELQPQGPARGAQQPQVGLVLPGVTLDATNSFYIARLTEAERDRPAATLAQVRDDVIRDAKLRAGYEVLIERRDGLFAQAQAGSIYDIATGALDQKVENFTRIAPPTIDDVRNTRPLVDAAFDLAEALRAGAGVDGTLSADRLITIELPLERKLLVFLVTEYKPVPRSAYQSMLDPTTSRQLTELSLRPVIPPDTNLNGMILETISLDAMIRYTEFKYAEGEGPSTEGAGDGTDPAEDE